MCTVCPKLLRNIAKLCDVYSLIRRSVGYSSTDQCTMPPMLQGNWRSSVVPKSSKSPQFHFIKSCLCHLVLTDVDSAINRMNDWWQIEWKWTEAVCLAASLSLCLSLCVCVRVCVNCLTWSVDLKSPRVTLSPLLYQVHWYLGQLRRAWVHGGGGLSVNCQGTPTIARQLLLIMGIAVDTAVKSRTVDKHTDWAPWSLRRGQWSLRH